MQKNRTKGTLTKKRILSLTIVVCLAASLSFCVFSEAFAAFNSDAASKVIGVGRIQSSSTAQAAPESETRFAGDTLTVKSEVADISVLATPLDRSIDEKKAEKAVAVASDLKRFGETDANGWFSTKASAYGPSSAGKYTALGTELTLTSCDIGVNIGYMDMVGRYVYLSYGGVTLKVRIVDTGSGGGPDRLFDLQPGVCTAFGAETPEFGWGVRTVKWRFAD